MTRNEHVTNKKIWGVTTVYKDQKHSREVTNLGNLKVGKKIRKWTSENRGGNSGISILKMPSYKTD
jgi:hypothetical protein